MKIGEFNKSETYAANATTRAFLAPKGGSYGHFLASSQTALAALLAL